MPTALELTGEQLKRYLRAARQRSAPPELTPAERSARQALLHRVAHAASLLKSRFGARRVFLFGSLAHQAWFASDSDVDLAVEGLRGRDYWEAWRAVEEIIGDREVDLIEIESASNSLRHAIERYGVEL
ncbi:MAG: nucleotidyltransferase domain-containing protein [Anaerolineae bacterium]|nr:nucleotidyltransferase domain-containing protein [Anaerolineae bacterium]